MAVIVVMLLSCLAYLALGSSSARVINWILGYVTPEAVNYRLLTRFSHSFCTAAGMLYVSSSLYTVVLLG